MKARRNRPKNRRWQGSATADSRGQCPSPVGIRWRPVLLAVEPLRLHRPRIAHRRIGRSGLRYYGRNSTARTSRWHWPPPVTSLAAALPHATGWTQRSSINNRPSGPSLSLTRRASVLSGSIHSLPNPSTTAHGFRGRGVHGASLRCGREAVPKRFVAARRHIVTMGLSAGTYGSPGQQGDSCTGRNGSWQP